MIAVVVVVVVRIDYINYISHKQLSLYLLMQMCMYVSMYVYLFQCEVKNDEELNSATQMTPRTIDGMKTHQVPRGSVLPIGINPRAG